MCAGHPEEEHSQPETMSHWQWRETSSVPHAHEPNGKNLNVKNRESVVPMYVAVYILANQINCM